MQTHQRREFSRSLAQLFAIYGEEITENLLSAWWAILEPYRLDMVQAAMNLHASDIEKGRWKPTPADVRGHLEKTLPAMAHAHCGRILAAGRQRMAVHREVIARLITDRQLNLIADEELSERIAIEHAHMHRIESEPAYQAALRGIQFRDDEGAAESHLPLAVRRSLNRDDG
jgi:hypothetical protein